MSDVVCATVRHARVPMMSWLPFQSRDLCSNLTVAFVGLRRGDPYPPLILICAEIVIHLEVSLSPLVDLRQSEPAGQHGSV